LLNGGDKKISVKTREVVTAEKRVVSDGGWGTNERVINGCGDDVAESLNHVYAVFVLVKHQM
jgi:hypothetical protein